MNGRGKKVEALCATMVIAAALVTTQVAAHGSRHAHWVRRHVLANPGVVRVIQCVAFAKRAAGIEISGNARDWWGNAAGIYERGSRPESGSVLSFRENERMPLGHVAVVSGIADSRTIMIDQSHWNTPGITRDIVVKDVSEYNDWSAVRVQLGRGAEFGSIYPTHGFIYPRPDGGSLVANVTPATMAGAAGRRVRLRETGPAVELAELPGDGKALDLRLPDARYVADRSSAP